MLTITVRPGAVWLSNFTWFAAERPEPPAVPYAGIRTGELIGHRLWWVIREHGEPWLCSLAHRRLWLPGEIIEGKIDEVVQDDWLTDWRIWGGVYAFAQTQVFAAEIAKELKHVAEWNALVAQGQAYALWPGVGWHAERETTTFVAGTVKMWGDVVEHERGYRAQFAKINSLDAIYGDDAVLDDLRLKYGIGHPTARDTFLSSFRVTGT